MITAIVFGATGLVGGYLIEELLKSKLYGEIKVFSRREITYESSKIKVVVIDLEKPELYARDLTGNHLFICLGTTIKKAGSVERVEQIDRDLPVSLAKIAHENKVAKMAIVSSVGAKARSRNYYVRIKGEMENEVAKLNFQQLAIVRPSLLLGNRSESRFGEKMGVILMNGLKYLLVGSLRKYRAIQGRTLARAMIKILNSGHKKVVIESPELHILGV